MAAAGLTFVTTATDTNRGVVHVALNRQWAANAYVCRSVASVVTGESHASWLRREHPRAAARG